MAIRGEVLQMITEAVKMPIPDGTQQLYQDLGMNSLSFIQLLLALEDRFAITFEISEMQSCLDINRLIERIETKVGGEENHP